MARNPQFDPFVSLSQNAAKLSKINRQWAKSNQFWRRPGFISILNLKPFAPCALQKYSAGEKLSWFIRHLSRHLALVIAIRYVWPVRYFSPTLQKIHRIPKFDLFHEVKMPSIWGKSTDHDQNLICSEGDQDTPACQFSGHSSHALSRKWRETLNLTCFSKSKYRQTKEY